MKAWHDAAPRILIVEDEQIVAADLEQSLQELGYDVVEITATGMGALRIAAEHRPDLVLMDIQLRGAMDGITAADEIIRKWQIPVVFVTANTNDEILSRAEAAGPYGYLIKPFRTKELNATMLVALHQHRRARQLFGEHAWLRQMLASLSDGVIATDVDARIRYLNPEAERLTGCNLEEAQGRCVREVLVTTTMSGDEVRPDAVDRTLRNAELIEKQRLLLASRKGGTTPIEQSSAPIVESGRVTGAVTVFLDITEVLRREREAEDQRDRLEEQVQTTTRALGRTRAELQSLSAHLMTAQEEERRRLARELHDDFGQRAAVLEMQVVRALESVADKKGESRQVLSEMKQQIQALGSDLRIASHRLHPAVLEDLGLLPALRSIVDDFQTAGAQISLRLPPSIDISLPTATGLYRIAQEALRNAAKHAPGAPVRVVLTDTPQLLQLDVEDDGPGFDLNSVRRRGGLGLLSMQERARLVGGELFIRTQPGNGTGLSVRIPKATPHAAKTSLRQPKPARSHA